MSSFDRQAGGKEMFGSSVKIELHSEEPKMRKSGNTWFVALVLLAAKVEESIAWSGDRWAGKFLGNWLEVC